MRHLDGGLRAAALGLVACAVSALPGCNCVNRPGGGTDPITLPHQVGSFEVVVTSVTDPVGQPLDVPTDGGLQTQDGGSDATAFSFPFGNVKMHVTAQALDENGQPYSDLNHPVAVRVTPGDIDPQTRSLDADAGWVEGDVLVSHVYGKVTVWVIDGPADEQYDSSGQPIVSTPPIALDSGYDFSNAAGVSQPIYFNRPSLSDVQRQPLCDPSQSFAAAQTTCDISHEGPHGNSQCTSGSTPVHCYQNTCEGSCDDTTSPLVGDFIDVEEPYVSDDQGMIVTAITQDGFYVTDLSAQKNPDVNDPAYSKWQALPSHFGHIFVYTYSAPPNLYVGDHIVSLTGSVQEFSGDTQLDFPGWIKVDQDPTPQYVPAPQRIDLHMCGTDATTSRAADLCGYFPSGTAALSLESLESAPVYVDHVTPSNLFVNCDDNGDSTLPLFAESSSKGWYCFPDDPNGEECACEIACITGQPQIGPDGGTIDYAHIGDPNDGGIPAVCSEAFTYTTYGQWDVVMADDLFDDGGVSIPSNGTHISVTTRDALSTFNPLDLQKPEFQGVTFRIAGMLSQVEAARPRWLIYARDPTDVCCYPAYFADGGSSGCPTGITSCVAIGQ